jgi:adenylate cyclase
MAGERIERRLAAVLAADVAGYSRLMAADEVGTLEALKAHRREIVDPAIAEYRGRIVKTTGDGMLVEFASVVDAVTGAMTVQSKMAERNCNVTQKIALRIGINIGEIIIDGDDIFGDGVNIAARVENECEPGGVFLSGSAFEQVRGKTNFLFEDLGERELKNIDRPVRLYAARSAGANRIDQSAVLVPSRPIGGATLPIPAKPSIAVLPFTNMSGDPAQEYFADGMVEDIITALSRLKSLFVIARNSSFTYKGKAVDIKQVGRELGVRYVLEGSVRCAGNRLRITSQLIETATGSHIWADRWDCGLTDIFEMQDEITARIQNAIGDTLVKTEAGRASRCGQVNLQVWQLRMQAWEGFHRWDRQGCLRGVELGREAMRLDPYESESYVATASCLYVLALSGWTESSREAFNEAVALLSRAISLDAEDAMAYSMLGVLLLAVGRHDEAMVQVRRAFALAPGSYYAALCSGIVLGYCGEPHDSLRLIETAVRVSPRDPRIYATYQSQCAPLFVLDRYVEVVGATQRVMRQLPTWPEAFTMQAAALARLGRLEEARCAVDSLLALDARYSLKRALRRHPYRNIADRDKLASALTQAGLL